MWDEGMEEDYDEVTEQVLGRSHWAEGREEAVLERLVLVEVDTYELDELTELAVGVAEEGENAWWATDLMQPWRGGRAETGELSPHWIH